MDTPEEVKKAASVLIRTGEVGDGVMDDAALRRAFYRSRPENADRTAGEVHTPSESGLTLGFGHDIGQSSAAEIDKFYGPNRNPRDMFPTPAILSDSERAVLKSYVGQPVVKLGKGDAAFIATTGIDITYEEATEVFEKHLLPKYIGLAKAAYPGFDDLPVKQQAAIVNRTYMRGDHPNPNNKNGRKAFADLRDAIFRRSTKEVYLALKNMERFHKKNGSPWKRAKINTALAKDGYLETTRMGPR